MSVTRCPIAAPALAASASGSTVGVHSRAIELRLARELRDLELLELMAQAHAAQQHEQHDETR